MKMRSKLSYSVSTVHRVPVVKVADYLSATSILKDRKKILKKLYEQTRIPRTRTSISRTREMQRAANTKTRDERETVRSRKRKMKAFSTLLDSPRVFSRGTRLPAPAH